VKDKNNNVLPIQGVAPSVLSIAGGYGSASATDVNIGFRDKYPFGDPGPSDFYIYVGHAYTEVSGIDDQEGNSFGIYKTTVRSVLDNVRINDVFSIEHAETILQSTHHKPGDGDSSEGEIVVGDSNMSGVRVDGRRVKVEKRDEIDRDSIRKFSSLLPQVQDQLRLAEFAGKGGPTGDPWFADLCSWSDPNAVPKDDEDLDYARDVAKINRDAKSHFRYSIFKDVDLDTPRRDVPRTVKTFKSSIFVKDFGRIFLGEVIASHGTKRATMFRIDLGCDNCGDVGGSGGSTNGGPMP